MKKKFAVGLLVVGCSFVAIRFLLSFTDVVEYVNAEPAYTRSIIEKTGGADMVLSASRQMLETFAPDETLLSLDVPMNDPRIPGVIRQMNPSEINVTRDRVLVILDEPGHRAYFLAFRNDADEFGTQMITNGLWYWNGTPSYETREIFSNQQARTRAYYDTIRARNENQ